MTNWWLVVEQYNCVACRLVAIWQKRFFGGRHVVMLGGSLSVDLACVSFFF
jgi:hypothetical protein